MTINHRDHENHMEWLNKIHATGLIDDEVLVKAFKSWYQIGHLSNWIMPVPLGCTGPDGSLMYCWNKDEHHLELEFFPGKSSEWFYRNRATEQLMDFTDFEIGNPVPPKLLETMKLFYEE